MKRILVPILAAASLTWGGAIVSTDTATGVGTSDLIIRLDAPFSGSINESGTEGATDLLISQITASIPKELIFSGGAVTKATLTPAPDGTGIIVHFESKEPLKVTASKSADGFGLRLRAQSTASAPVYEGNDTNRSSPSPLPALKTSAPQTEANATLPASDIDFGWRYLVAIVFMAAMVIILLLVKRKFAHPGKGGWLLGKNDAPAAYEALFSRAFDPQNRVVLFRLNGVKYLVLLGTTNILLDRFDDEVEVTSENEFDQILRNNEEKLDAMLGHRGTGGFENYRTKAENQLGDF